MARTGYNKYHNNKIDGFDSTKERDRWHELSLMQRAGIISDLQRQVTFTLIPRQFEQGKREEPVKYIADFVYMQNGKQVVEDCKGYRGGEAYKLFVIKRKLMLWVHHIRVIET